MPCPTPDPAALCRIGLTPDLTAHLRRHLPPAAGSSGDAPDDPLPPGLARVVAVHRDRVDLHDGRDLRSARIRPSLRDALKADDDAVAVGDWVLAEPDVAGDPWVAWRCPPRTRLARRSHDGRDQAVRRVLVANVDTVLVVMGLDGDFNLRRLERFWALARGEGLAAVVVLTKADRTADAAGRIAQVARSLPPGTAVVAVDAREPSAAEVLRPWLRPGDTLVAVGSSGAGKSTLTRTLATTVPPDGSTGSARPALSASGATRPGDDRGRHTTTVRVLHPLPVGACVIDTPGVRTLRLDGDADDVDAAFEEVTRLAAACRFRDCRHEAEPGCAVRAGVPAERLANWRKLQREARHDTLTLAEQRARQAVWKARSKAARAAARAPRPSGGRD